MESKAELVKKLESILQKVEEIEKVVDKQTIEIKDLKSSHISLYEELHRKKQHIDRLEGRSTEVGSNK